MASGRLRLSRPGPPLQLPLSKSVRVIDEPGLLPPLVATSHWILNDRLIGQLQHKVVGSSANSGRFAADRKKVVSNNLSGRSVADVIVISSSQEDNSASDCSFISECEDAIDSSAHTMIACGVLQDAGVGHPAASELRSDDDGCDEQVYNFGEEEELLSQAAVAKWQEGPEAQSILDKDRHGTHGLPEHGCPALPSPAQELMAFLTLKNLDTLQPTLMAHEVVSLNCMCMLTQNDIACAAPLPLAPCCLRIPVASTSFTRC